MYGIISSHFKWALTGVAPTTVSIIVNSNICIYFLMYKDLNGMTREYFDFGILHHVCYKWMTFYRNGMKIWMERQDNGKWVEWNDDSRPLFGSTFFFLIMEWIISFIWVVWLLKRNGLVLNFFNFQEILFLNLKMNTMWYTTS